ncbi:MAG: hypothetical protein Q4D21_04050 [Phascolarctobacterium sp.]|nr:hypothetical protein [Phascolarctobacterium sp.]
MAEIGKIRIAYTGEALENGAMDINDLAPALMAYGNLIKRVNEISKSNGKVRAQLSADSIRKGSFDVSIEIIYEGIEQIKMFVGMDKDNGLLDIMTVLGWGVTGKDYVGNVFTLIKCLSGRKIAKINHKEDCVEIYIHGGEVIKTTNISYNIFIDGDSRNQIEKILDPLKKDGVDGFEIRNPNDFGSKDCLEQIRKDEIDKFKTSELAVVENQTKAESVIFRIVDLSFNDEHKWRLANSTGNHFWMKIEDKDFIEMIKSGEIKFGAGDMLRIDYTNTQKIHPSGAMTEEYAITKVYEVIEKPTQIKLDFES